MEAVFNFLAARKIQHTKRHFDIMRRAVHACGCTILYFVISHLAFIVFGVFYFIVLKVAPLPNKHVRPETVVALCFLPLMRLPITTSKGYLVPIYKLKLLVSNLGSV